MVEMELGNTIEVKPVCEKARLSILVTELGIATEVRFKQFWNAHASIDEIESGMVMDVRLELLNALNPIAVIDRGIVMLVTPQP